MYWWQIGYPPDAGQYLDPAWHLVSSREKMIGIRWSDPQVGACTVFMDQGELASLLTALIDVESRLKLPEVNF